MARVLSVSLRPQRFATIIGQDALLASIQKQVATRPPQSWMFYGPTGCGKTTLARIIAVSYQCVHSTVFGEPCKECYAHRSEFDFHEINAGTTRGIEEMGKIEQMARFHPIVSKKRVFLIDEFHKATPDAQSLLLKPTEEPPPTTIWIICTNEPQKILATLRGRFTTYELRGLNHSDREKLLMRAAKVASFTSPLTDLFEAVHEARLSSPRSLLQVLEKFIAGMPADEAVAGIEGSVINGLALCKALTSGSWKEIEKILDKANPEDARYIRSSTANWLRGFLRNARDPREQERAVKSIDELLSPAPFEDANMLTWLYPRLWTIARRYAAK